MKARFYFSLLYVFCFFQACKPVPKNPPSSIISVSQEQLQVAEKVNSEDTIVPPAVKKEEISKLEQILIDSGLVDVGKQLSGIGVEMAYSTEDNFIGADVYGDFDKCYLRPPAAKALEKARAFLKEKNPNLDFLMYDCCRPRSVQFIMWDSLQIPNKINYLANPHKGSVHNYGLAVDLTIMDKNGEPLDMGTPFDFFGVKAHTNKNDYLLEKGLLTQKQINNRLLLKSVMRKAGFWGIKSEWWHFNCIQSKLVKQKYRMIP